MRLAGFGDHLLDRIHLQEDPTLLLEQLIHDADQQQEDEELNDDQAQDGCAHPMPLRVPLDLSVLPTTKSQVERVPLRRNDHMPERSTWSTPG